MKACSEPLLGTKTKTRPYYLGWSLWALSLYLYYKGVTLDLWQIMDLNPDGSTYALHLNPWATYQYELKHSSKLVAAWIAITTFLIPALKLVVAAWIMIREWWTSYSLSWQASFSRRFLEISSSYQLNDIYLLFTVASFLGSGPGAGTANMKIHTGAYYFFSYVLVSMILADLIEASVMPRDKTPREEIALDRPAVLVLGGAFVLAWPQCLFFKVLDLQYHVFFIGVTSFPHSVAEIAYYAWGFLPDIICFLVVLNALVLPVLYVGGLLAIATGVRGKSGVVACMVSRIRQFATLDVFCLSVFTVMFALEGKYSEPLAPHVTTPPFVELSLGLGLRPDHYLAQLFCPMNLLALSGTAYCTLRWCWQDSSMGNLGSAIKIGLVFAICAGLCHVNAVAHSPNRFSTAQALRFTINYANRFYFQQIPHCVGLGAGCNPCCVKGTGFGCYEAVTDYLGGMPITYRVDWVRGMDSMQLESMELHESCAADAADGPTCAVGRVSATLTWTFAKLTAHLQAHGKLNAKLITMDARAVEQDISLVPSGSRPNFELRTKIGGRCRPAGSIHREASAFSPLSNFTVEAVELSGYELRGPSVTAEYVGDVSALVKSIIGQAIKPTLDSFRPALSHLLNLDDPLPMIEVSLPILMNMIAISNSEAGIFLCPDVKQTLLV